LETFMARTSQPGNGAGNGAGTGQGATPPDIDAARKLVASSLQQEHRLLQWLAQAQSLQADALKALDGVVSAAASSAQQASAWEDLFSVQRKLMSEGLARLTDGETTLMSSWIDLQTEFAQQFQNRADDMARKLWNGSPPRDDAAPSAAALTPAVWFEQSQAALQSMLRPWGTVLPDHQRH
jgi:hypothetical protein